MENKIFEEETKEKYQHRSPLFFLFDLHILNVYAGIETKVNLQRVILEQIRG